MNLSSFLNSYGGMFIVQSFFHALIAAIIVDRAIQAWRIRSPLIKQRFRLIVIMLPILSFPVYQMLTPERGSISFRVEALFDSSRWLNVELWGAIPLSYLFIAMLIITTTIFLFQELVPIIKHAFESKKKSFVKHEVQEPPVIKEAVNGLPDDRPEIHLINDDSFVLFSTTGSKPAIFLSTSLMESLNADELRAAFAHEIAHVVRNRMPLLIIAFLLRMIVFFNPVILLEFRRAVQDEEKICDDEAVDMTQKPQVLADALKKIYHKMEGSSIPFSVKSFSEVKESIESYSYNMHIESRVRRLENGLVKQQGREWAKLLLTGSVVMILNYFIV